MLLITLRDLSAFKFLSPRSIEAVPNGLADPGGIGNAAPEPAPARTASPVA